jgi:hypothetical protein
LRCWRQAITLSAHSHFDIVDERICVLLASTTPEDLEVTAVWGSRFNPSVPSHDLAKAINQPGRSHPLFNHGRLSMQRGRGASNPLRCRGCAYFVQWWHWCNTLENSAF